MCRPQHAQALAACRHLRQLALLDVDLQSAKLLETAVRKVPLLQVGMTRSACIAYAYSHGAILHAWLAHEHNTR